MGPEEVAQDPLVPRRPARQRHHMQEVAAGAVVGPHEQEPIGHAVVVRIKPQIGEAALVLLGRFEVTHGGHEIEDGFGGQPRDRRRTDVLDLDEETRRRGAEGVDHGCGSPRPFGVVVDDTEVGRRHDLILRQALRTATGGHAPGPVPSRAAYAPGMISSNALDRRSLAATALFAALALTGCTAESDAPDSPTESSTGQSAGAETTAESEPTEEPSPSAADGSDYAACDDGSCEVLVSGEAEFEFEEFTLTVTISEDGIETYTANGDNTQSGSSSMGGSGMSDAYCVAYLSAGSNTMQCYPDIEPEEAPEPETEPGVLVLEMLDFEEGTAVIRLTMGD
jgi:hypothetical protein